MRGQPDAGGGSHEDAGRAAYLAAFRAAHALIFEREHRTLKTHGGVQSEFAKLVKDDQAVPAELRGFVSRAYAFNTITDYDPLTSVPPTADDARSPIETAARFVDEVARIAILPSPTRDAQDNPRP